MSNQVAPIANGVIEALVLSGDLSRMNDQQKVSYYKAICDHLGLNPFSQPFRIMKFQGRETMYATKDCTDQLRKRDNIDVVSMTSEVISGIYIVTVKVKNQAGKTDMDIGAGKTDMDIGAVNIEGLKGDALANAFMKATTKAKRRATLSICGLGIMDESEIETVDAHAVVTDFPQEKKKPITDEAFEKGVKRIAEGERQLIKRLRHTFTLTDAQATILLGFEDANTITS